MKHYLMFTKSKSIPESLSHRWDVLCRKALSDHPTPAASSVPLPHRQVVCLWACGSACIMWSRAHMHMLSHWDDVEPEQKQNSHKHIIKWHWKHQPEWRTLASLAILTKLAWGWTMDPGMGRSWLAPLRCSVKHV